VYVCVCMCDFVPSLVRKEAKDAVDLKVFLCMCVSVVCMRMCFCVYICVCVCDFVPSLVKKEAKDAYTYTHTYTHADSGFPVRYSADT
jgi:hypothetical protein